MIPLPKVKLRASRPGRPLSYLDATLTVEAGRLMVESSLHVDPDALWLPRPFLRRDNPEMAGVRFGPKSCDDTFAIAVLWHYPEP